MITKSKSTIYSRYFTYIKPLMKYPIIKNYAPAVFTLLTISILTLFAIKPTIETIIVLQKKLDDSEALLQKVTQKTNDLSLGKKNYDNLNQNIKEKISAAIPNTITFRSIIQALEQAAQAHEASISALQFQPLVIDPKVANKIGSLTEIPFTFNIEGNYNNMLSLLKELNTSGRLMSVESLSLSKTSDGTGLVMSLSGKAYYLK